MDTGRGRAAGGYTDGPHHNDCLSAEAGARVDQVLIVQRLRGQSMRGAIVLERLAGLNAARTQGTQGTQPNTTFLVAGLMS
jgi:hypothetical protein